MAEGWADGGQQTLPGLLDRRLAADPDGAFLDVCGTSFTAAAIDAAAGQVAGALAALGVGRGRRWPRSWRTARRPC
jgi:carnitine-CoA ligase